MTPSSLQSYSFIHNINMEQTLRHWYFDFNLSAPTQGVSTPHHLFIETFNRFYFWPSGLHFPKLAPSPPLVLVLWFQKGYDN